MSIKGISNAQESVAKLSGISIASAGQLIVRGLGDRYSTTTLNGLPIASPNPDNKLIPLDIFPASTIQNITVSKVYEVSSFADYSGAHTNAGSGSSEIGNASYGGDVEDDNSGTIEYVVIRNSGYALDSEHEANGISLYGVGSGTTISNVYVVNGSDDGIEFFGGSVNIDHCIVEDCTDDSFDWTEGWNGTAEYIVAYQTVDGCDCLMECDNNGAGAVSSSDDWTAWTR